MKGCICACAAPTAAPPLRSDVRAHAFFLLGLRTKKDALLPAQTLIFFFFFFLKSRLHLVWINRVSPSVCTCCFCDETNGFHWSEKREYSTRYKWRTVSPRILPLVHLTSLLYAKILRRLVLVYVPFSSSTSVIARRNPGALILSSHFLKFCYVIF